MRRTALWLLSPNLVTMSTFDIREFFFYCVRAREHIKGFFFSKHTRKSLYLCTHVKFCLKYNFCLGKQRKPWKYILSFSASVVECCENPKLTTGRDSFTNILYLINIFGALLSQKIRLTRDFF